VFPWSAPVYFLDINATYNVQDCFRVDSFADPTCKPCKPWQFVSIADKKRSIVINSCCHSFTSIKDVINELKKNTDGNQKLEIEGNLILINNKLTSLKQIHELINRIDGFADFRGNPIQSSVLGLIIIKELKRVLMDNKEVEEIINKHLSSERDILECQEELITNGYREYAKL
jgi:hypothetical protein